MVKKQSRANSVTSAKSVLAGLAPDLLNDLRTLIEKSRERMAQQVNAELVLLNWHMGQRIRKDILSEGRGEYGKQIVETIAKQLTAEYGRGYSRPALFRMVKFAEVFTDSEIVSTLSRQIGWSHFIELLHLKDALQLQFYTEMCRLERWSVRTLRHKIGGMLYERTAIAKKPVGLVEKELAALKEEDFVTPDLVFRDPYVLDFLGLTGYYSEKQLEDAILRELEQFILELGNDFCFVARQKRIVVDNEDFYIDLLFYHRGLRRLVVIEVKLERFSPAYKGQLELYLRWLDKHERRPGEEAPIGLILCAGKSPERIELLSLDASGIRVAEYLTELPPKPVLEAKLQKAIRLARERLASDGDDKG